MFAFHFLKNGRKLLTVRGYTGAMLMDLSKSFDTENHELLIAKLYACRFSKDAMKLIFSYISDRWQKSKSNK